ncbi:hypothetical protein ACTQ3J_11045 [Oscillospiraceae bacterium LCP25S3_E3]
MKKIISMILVICLLTVSTVWTASAYDNNIEDVNVDGYNITINENTGDETVVSTFVDGVKYQITFDKDANDFEMITNEYAAYIFGIGIGACNEEIYDVDVENLDEDGIEAEIISEDTEDVTRISDDMVEVQAAVVAAGGTAIAIALLKAILAVTAAIIIAGVVYYAASSVISRLKRDQPQVHYYKAYLQTGDNVYVGPKLNSKSAAASVLKAGNSVFAISSGYAYDACKSASPISTVSSKQKHSGDGKNYYHYHPMIKKNSQSKAHCWFV